MGYHLFKVANFILNKYKLISEIGMESYHQIKFAANVTTKEFSKYSPEMEKYKDQIMDLLIQRYEQELGFKPVGSSIEEYIPSILFVTIDEDSDTVLSVSGVDQNYGTNRVKMFAAKPAQSLGGAKIMTNAAFQQLENLFSAPNSFAELSFKLFEQFKKLYELYKKKHNGEAPFELYYFPAEEAVKLIPRRKVLVSDDGVVYSKRVVGANTFTNKIVIGNSSNINGAIGYPSMEEASSSAKHKNKLIEGRNGYVRILDFDPNLWGSQS